jgi:hypothetical protein
MTVTVEVINNRALNLLSDMEYLDLIKVNIPTGSVSNEKLSGRFAGALKLSDEKYEYYQKALQEGRDEWDRDIY